MANILAKIGIYGDIHLSSKNHGAHRDYPNESLHYFQEITRVTKEKGITHLIGCGDFTFGRFHSLEYREAVEKELSEQFRLTNGNRWELRGNHDEAGYGLTERDFYVSKGLLKGSENLSIGSLNITMVDYGKTADVIPNIIDDETHINVIIAHDYLKFSNTQLPNFGKAIDIDNFTQWFGCDYLVCGHIHKILDFSGYIVKDENMVHECKVHYMGCMSRPAFSENGLDEVGQVLIITVMDDGTVDVDFENIQLWSIEESFNIEMKAEEKKKKEEKINRVDISDVVKQLDSHDRNIGSVDQIIESMTDVPEKYKDKAISLLSMALG